LSNTRYDLSATISIFLLAVHLVAVYRSIYEETGEN